MAWTLTDRGFTKTNSFTNGDVADTFTPDENDIIVVATEVGQFGNNSGLGSVTGFGATWVEIALSTSMSSKFQMWAARMGSSPGSDRVFIDLDVGASPIGQTSIVFQIKGASTTKTVGVGAGSLFPQVEITAVYDPSNPIALTDLNAFESTTNLSLTVQSVSVNNAFSAKSGWFEAVQSSGSPTRANAAAFYLETEDVSHVVTSTTDFDFDRINAFAIEVAEEAVATTTKLQPYQLPKILHPDFSNPRIKPPNNYGMDLGSRYNDQCEFFYDGYTGRDLTGRGSFVQNYGTGSATNKSDTFGRFTDYNDFSKGYLTPGLNSGVTAYSVTMVFKPRSMASWGFSGLYGKATSGTSNSFKFYRTSSGNWQVEQGGQDTSVSTTFSSDVNDDEFNVMTVVWDGATAFLYLNGELNGSVANTGTPATGAGHFFVAANTDTYGSDVDVYYTHVSKRAFSAGEVLALHAAPFQIYAPVDPMKYYAALAAAVAATVPQPYQLPSILHPDFAARNKPSLGDVEIDHSNPISQGLKFVGLFNGFRLEPIIGPEPSKQEAVATALGLDMSGGDLEHRYLIDDLPLDHGTGGKGTIMYGAAAGSGTGSNFGSVLSSVTSSEFDILRISATNLRFRIFSVDLQITTLPNMDDGRPHKFAFGWDQAKSHKSMTVDQDYNESSSAFSGTRTVTEYNFNSSWNGGGGQNQILEYIFMWDRALSEAEIRSLHLNMYQVLKPKVPMYYYVPGTGVVTPTGAVISFEYYLMLLSNGGL